MLTCHLVVQIHVLCRELCRDPSRALVLYLGRHHGLLLATLLLGIDARTCRLGWDYLCVTNFDGVRLEWGCLSLTNYVAEMVASWLIDFARVYEGSLVPLSTSLFGNGHLHFLNADVAGIFQERSCPILRELEDCVGEGSVVVDFSAFLLLDCDLSWVIYPVEWASMIHQRRT